MRSGEALVLVPKTRGDIDDREVEAMFSIFEKFTNITEEVFPSRVDKYQHFGMAYAGDRLVGYVGYNIKEVPLGDRTIISIYMGITAVEHEFRGRGLVPRVVWTAIVQAMYRFPLKPKYVWCHARSYKPYLFFTRYVKVGHPRRQVPQTPEVLAIRDALIAAEPEDLGQKGWVSTRRTTRYIIDETTKIRPEDLADPDIRFYQEMCPDPLCGLYTYFPVSVENAVAHASKEVRRLFSRVLRRG